jgi:hypothetical protein
VAGPIIDPPPELVRAPAVIDAGLQARHVRRLVELIAREPAALVG